MSTGGLGQAVWSPYTVWYERNNVKFRLGQNLGLVSYFLRVKLHNNDMLSLRKMSLINHTVCTVHVSMITAVLEAIIVQRRPDLPRVTRMS